MAALFEIYTEENPKAAKKIEAGIKAKEKKDKNDVEGSDIMKKDYAAMMGGYSPIKKVGDKEIRSSKRL